MYGRTGLDRFMKAQPLEPFSIPSFEPQTSHLQIQLQQQHQGLVPQNPVEPEVTTSVVTVQQVTQVGDGQSTWQPPDWSIEPQLGVYYLEVFKDGEVLGRINLDKQMHIFGRQFPVCDFVLDHQSVSHQHAAVVPHRNGSIYVIDLGSAHGTFVANKRLTKESPVELEIGQSLRFATSTRSYILRKNNDYLSPSPTEVNLPSSSDPSDKEAILTYNTVLNRYGLTGSDVSCESAKGVRSLSSKSDKGWHLERAAKRIRKARVAFKDQFGGELVEIVGFSDGADVETEPGPIGVKEGSLVGKFESLVQITVVPKGK